MGTSIWEVLKVQLSLVAFLVVLAGTALDSALVFAIWLVLRIARSVCRSHLSGAHHRTRSSLRSDPSPHRVRLARLRHRRRRTALWEVDLVRVNQIGCTNRISSHHP